MDDFEREKFLQLRAKGKSYSKIASEMKKTKPTMIAWGKKLENEVRNRRALEIEDLLDQYQALKEQRIRTLGEALQVLKERAKGIEALGPAEAARLVPGYLRALRGEDIDVERVLKVDPEKDSTRGEMGTIPEEMNSHKDQGVRGEETKESSDEGSADDQKPQFPGKGNQDL